MQYAIIAHKIIIKTYYPENFFFFNPKLTSQHLQIVPKLKIDRNTRIDMKKHHILSTLTLTWSRPKTTAARYLLLRLKTGPEIKFGRRATVRRRTTIPIIRCRIGAMMMKMCVMRKMDVVCMRWMRMRPPWFSYQIIINRIRMSAATVVVRRLRGGCSMFRLRHYRFFFYLHHSFFVQRKPLLYFFHSVTKKRTTYKDLICGGGQSGIRYAFAF